MTYLKQVIGNPANVLKIFVLLQFFLMIFFVSVESTYVVKFIHD